MKLRYYNVWHLGWSDSIEKGYWSDYNSSFFSGHYSLKKKVQKPDKKEDVAKE